MNNVAGFSTSTNTHGHVCPTCGHDAVKLLEEIERLRQRVYMLERYGVDPWPATGTNVDEVAILTWYVPLPLTLRRP